jgi:hypothetical protein
MIASFLLKKSSRFPLLPYRRTAAPDLDIEVALDCRQRHVHDGDVEARIA